MSAKSTNYWLGGYWTNGLARGLKWQRGQWLNGSLIKGQWYSYDLELEWDKTDSSRNNWSFWKGGTWKSNSQNNYKFNDFKIEDEYSVWHGGTWQSETHKFASYTWQGTNVSDLEVYGDTEFYTADEVNPDTVRQIALPNAKSLFLGGQWLRGVWEGGIFANSVWHSTPISTTKQITFDIQVSNNPLVFYNEAENTTLEYLTELDYDEDNSEFRSGAFVNSVWEGGVVFDTSDDPYNNMFGMSLSIDNSRIVFDDGGIQLEYGFLESNALTKTRYYGLEMPNWQKYFSDDTVLNKKISGSTSEYVFPNDLTNSDFYSVIWKRGKFGHGAFNYGQFHNYDPANNIITEYIADDNIHDKFADFSTYNSLFKKGLMYRSLFYGGVYLAQYSTPDEQFKSVFNRSIWMTGYWATHTESLYEIEAGINLPISTYTDDRYVTNARLWKSVWLSGIWEGGDAIMSAWNCVNPFSYDITINNQIFTPSATDVDELENLILNPLGKITTYDYYDEYGELYEEFQNVILDFDRTDLLNPISPDQLTDPNLAVDSAVYIMYFFEEDENGYTATYVPSGRGYPAGAPYDVVLYDDGPRNYTYYDYEDFVALPIQTPIDLTTLPIEESDGILSRPNTITDQDYFYTEYTQSNNWISNKGGVNNTTYITTNGLGSFDLEVSHLSATTSKKYIFTLWAKNNGTGSDLLTVSVNGAFALSQTITNDWTRYAATINVFAGIDVRTIHVELNGGNIDDVTFYREYTLCPQIIPNVLICPNDNVIPIDKYSNPPSILGDDVGLGLIMYNQTETALNPDLVNENIFKTLGQVHNLLSVWQNGSFEGGVWNGGLWIKGEFKPYKFEDYPTNVVDSAGIQTLLDYFDDNVIDKIALHVNNPIWTRGVWYGGYFRADSIFVAIAAYIRDSQVNIDLDYKLCITDDILSNAFNNPAGSVLPLKPLNMVSIFTRKSIRNENNESNFFFAVMNGQLSSGYFQDRSRIESSDMDVVPLLGTIIDEFENDIDTNGISKFTFGNVRVDEVKSNETLITTMPDGYVQMKNSSESTKVNIVYGLPEIYDPINITYTNDVSTGANKTDKFYYEYYLKSVGPLPSPELRVKLKHARDIVFNSQPVWTDIEPQSETAKRVPSYAQGGVKTSEPYTKL